MNSVDSGKTAATLDLADAAQRGLKSGLSGASHGVLANGLEALLIVAVSVATGIGYHYWAYESVGHIEGFLAVGLLTALIYMVPLLLADQHRVEAYLEGRRSAQRIILVWHYTILCLVLLAFMTKTSEQFSRGWLALFYVSGLVSVICFEHGFRKLLKLLLAAGHIRSRRMIVVGTAPEVAQLADSELMRQSGVHIIASVVLPRNAADGNVEASDDILSSALAKARLLHVDDVVILLDWSEAQALERIVHVFSQAPVEIHLGASRLIDRFSSARVSRLPALTALSLTAPALGPLQSVIKRVSDVFGSLVALVLLAPVLAVIAILIKLDSPGPVFFRQRRNGFNGHQFQIWKFRTMSTMDDGDVVVQARRGDDRITRVGGFLRRHSLDELPQLINVAKGEMSLVGPRPHAVSHDQIYGRLIETYARRFNVLPGITGWAQVNGSRGPTATPEDMRRRVELDLYYIDHWSIPLDFYILLRTVIWAARHNAF